MALCFQSYLLKFTRLHSLLVYLIWNDAANSFEVLHNVKQDYTLKA